MRIFEWENGTKVEPAKVTISGQVYEVEDAQYEGETPISASNLNEMQRTLNSNMEWTLVGSAVGGNTLNIPSGANELLAIVKVNNNNNLQYVFNIPTAYLTTSTQAFNDGYYWAASYNAYTRVGISSSQAYLMEVRSNNDDALNTSILTLYYR